MRTVAIHERIRQLAVVVATAAMSFAMLAGSAGASTPTHGSGIFAFTAAPTVTSTRTADGNTITETTAPGVLGGALSGAFSLRQRTVTHANGETNSRGLVTCVCTIGGNSGTIQIRFEGTGSGTGATATLDGQFVLQNGTAGLSDLHGQGTFSAIGTGGTYTVNHHFD